MAASIWRSSLTNANFVHLSDRKYCTSYTTYAKNTRIPTYNSNILTISDPKNMLKIDIINRQVNPESKIPPRPV